MSIDVAAIRPRLEAAFGERLQLGDLLGRGGFGAVFRARDPFLERDVAVKVLDPSLSLDVTREEQFLHEARTIAAVEHPHIVPLYSAALAAAHAVGVVHRDIKPANILLDGNGNATVTDFGIALVTSRPVRESSGVTAGTPHYMSPEQALGEQVDGRSDVYALGVVLYEMLTGARPFTGRNATEVIARHISAPIPRVSDREPETPAALVRVVSRMLTKDPAGRPSADELVAELTAASDADAILAPSQVRRRRWKRRALYLTIAGVSAGAVAVVGVRLALQVMRFVASGGEGADPALLASGGSVPDSIVQQARAAGIVGPAERVGLVFIKAGRIFPDALLVTDSAIIRSAPTGTIRRSRQASDINLQPLPRGGSQGGLLIVTLRGEAPDTLYQDLTSREGLSLANEFQAWARAERARAATAEQSPK